MIIKLVLLSLAVYRLAWLTSVDIGPFGIFDRIRLWFLSRVRDEDRDYWIIEGVHCPYCHSVWYAAIAALLMQPASVTEYIMFWLGIAGAVLLLLTISERKA